MRKILRSQGWTLIAGEYPGGSDHELYPLNVVDPALARDRSPDPRRHSFGELIPDVVAQKGQHLILGEAKVAYNEGDRLKLIQLLGPRRQDLLFALEKFSLDRNIPSLRPVDALILHPVLVFANARGAPAPGGDISYLQVYSRTEGRFDGALASNAQSVD